MIIQSTIQKKRFPRSCTCYGPYNSSDTATKKGLRQVGHNGAGRDGTSQTIGQGLSESHS